MIKMFLVAGVLLLTAAPLHAHVRPGSLPSSGKMSGSQAADPIQDPLEPAGDGSSADRLPVQHHEDEEDPSQPVPEPGTMALGAMGMMALGAAIRKRRKKS